METEELTAALRKIVTLTSSVGALVHRWDPHASCLSLIADSGIVPEKVKSWENLNLGANVIPIRALRYETFTWVAGESLGIGENGTAAIPLMGPNAPIGVLTVLVDASDEPDYLRRSILGRVATQITTLLEGCLDTTSQDFSSLTNFKQATLVDELTIALSKTITCHDVVKVIAEHVLSPFGADGLIVFELAGGRVYIVGSSGYPQEFLELIQGLPLTDQAPVVAALQRGTPLFIRSRTEYHQYWPMWCGTHLSPMEAWVFLPLIASGRSMGVCVVAFRQPHSFRNQQERALFTALSGCISQAYERARLYDVEHARAQELQRGLLPRNLPELPALCAAARYLPAGTGEDVGGDWYDVIPLSADRVAVVVGDVMGRGITEAATMARLRTAIRTLAHLDISPDELLSHLNDLVIDLGDDFYATCLYIVFDPVEDICAISSAGHPPPMIVQPDGRIYSPDLDIDPPLGSALPPFAVRELKVPNGVLLVLFTNGLVESVTRDIDQGLTQLRAELAQATNRSTCLPGNYSSDHNRKDLEELCDAIVTALLPDQSRIADDVALLIVHTRSIDDDHVAVCALPEDPQAAGQARIYIRKQLKKWNLEDLITTTELVVSELVGNVIRHAKGPIRLRLLYSRTLICEVYDSSSSMPRIRHAAYTDEDGRGLQLIAAVSQRWGARYLRDGKCIWTEQEILRRAS
ncbi:SpoIIE family protein phosphatase [Streptomyces sp. NPDC057062]|uniref:ATP-binding SpoIIE family protein phosphatase n=1 Tax=Streptomyces sp. NPDC057062 TaxID=3346011 RepID=UPI0036336F88